MGQFQFGDTEDKQEVGQFQIGERENNNPVGQITIGAMSSINHALPQRRHNVRLPCGRFHCGPAL